MGVRITRFGVLIFVWKLALRLLLSICIASCIPK